MARRMATDRHHDTGALGVGQQLVVVVGSAKAVAPASLYSASQTWRRPVEWDERGGRQSTHSAAVVAGLGGSAGGPDSEVGLAGNRAVPEHDIFSGSSARALSSTIPALWRL